MKKTLFLLLISFHCFKAQVTSLDCMNALTITSGYTVTLFANTGSGSIIDLTSLTNVSNPTVNPIGTNSGCMLAGEYEPGWYIFKVCNTGLLEFVIGGYNGPFPQQSFYDWSLWKYSPATCTKIKNNQLPPLRCNWNGTDLGGTGICDTMNLPPGGSKYNYEPPLPVNAGDTLVLCFSNYSNVNYYMDFVSIGTSGICLNLITDLPSHENTTQKALFYNSHSTKIEILDRTITSTIIHDLQGKVILRTDNINAIDCSNFIKGIYFVTTYRKENIPKTEKIIID